MSFDNLQISSSAEALRWRLRQARGVLLVTALVLTAIAYRAPAYWPELLAAFLLICLAAVSLPRRNITRAASGAAPVRAPMWPGSEMKVMCEALGYSAYLIDRAGVLRYQNGQSEQVFGAARTGDPIGFKFRNPEIVRLINQATATGERQEMEYHDPSPPNRWFWLSITPVPKPENDVVENFYLLSFFDLTETKRVEQMRSDFVANASHELRTPLASLRGFIETIQGPAANDPRAARQFLELMLEQAERMTRLIDDLLSLTRIEMKAHLRPRGEVDIAEVLRHVADTLSRLASKLGVELRVDLAVENLMVTGERDELIQVFENLVENACKYGRSGKRVDILARIQQFGAEDCSVIVSVRDYGPGIAAEHLPRLTERFYRVDTEASRESRGTGLGLAIVKHILTRHGARLAIESTLGEGAEFSVVFPLR
jgi:two-component system, OmpR family, phosphate regulon sensor histidine kinase PhoR